MTGVTLTQSYIVNCSFQETKIENAVLFKKNQETMFKFENERKFCSKLFQPLFNVRLKELYDEKYIIIEQKNKPNLLVLNLYKNHLEL